MTATEFAVARKRLSRSQKGMSLVMWEEALFHSSGSRASKRAEAGSPRKSEETLSISSRRMSGFFVCAWLMGFVDRPGIAAM